MTNSVDQQMSSPEATGEVATEQRQAISQDGQETVLQAADLLLVTPQPSPPNPLVGLIGLLIVYLGIAIAFSQIIPFNKGPDEGYHLEYITFLKQNGRLPISYEERAQITRADFPPLYHLLVAALSAGVPVNGPPNFKIFWDSFRYRAMDLQNDQVWTISTEDYQWPYFGRFLVWQIGRWFSIALSLATIAVTFFALQETPLGKVPLLSLAGAALLAFIPQYIFLGSTLNDDNLLGLLAALYFWLLIKLIKQPEPWWPYIGIGIVLGLSLTVKYTLVLAPLELLLVGILIMKKKAFSWRWLWLRLGVIGSLMLLCSGWWFGWNFWFLNSVAENGWFVGLLHPLLAGGSDMTMNRLSGFFSGGQIGRTELPEDIKIGTFSGWLGTTFLSFWAVSIGDTIPFSPYAYLIVVLILGISLFGLWRLWQKHIFLRSWILLMGLHVAIFTILPLIRFGLSRRLGQTAQGRHILIPAAVAVAALIVWGVASATPQRWQRWTFGLIICGLFAWTVAHVYALATFTAPLLPVRALPQAAQWLSHPIKAQFGDAIELVSYDLDLQPDQGQLHLNLAWRSLAHVNESYLLKIDLLNNQDQIVSHWIGNSGQGRLPTLAWDPGDSVFDRVVLPLPNLPAGDHTVQVQLLGSAGPLPVSEPGGETTASLKLPSTVSLDRPSILSYPQYLSVNEPANPVEISFVIWPTEGPAKVTSFFKSQLPMPIYRYPATISIATSGDLPNDLSLDLQLVDPDDQAWPVIQNQADIYTFVIGPRWTSGAYRLKMVLRQGDSIIGQATSEPLLTVENWWPRNFDVPEIASPAEANFANQVRFLGYKLPQNQVKAGESFPLTLYWQALPDHPPQADFIQFNHLLDSHGTLHGGYDRRALEYYGTLLWAPDEVVIDGYSVPVDADAPPGQYYLSVGYYLTVGVSAVNLPLVKDGQMSDVTSVTIGPIEVIAP